MPAIGHLAARFVQIRDLDPRSADSIVGSFIGGRLLGLVSPVVRLPLLAVILMLSAIKAWQHK